MSSAVPGGSIRYLPTEVQARFQVWSSLPGLPGVRDETWAAYVDARDQLPPGSTLKMMRERNPGTGLSAPRLTLLARQTPPTQMHR